ncbi:MULTISPECIES: GNAT family N-acetyltransferase [Prauserella salsuginis group]|uniref:RimJ/RimL family protein N-acetyltransferase n=2 Tax=Prauserella salsuginis group TaxID=2893672 RepID=A0A839XJF3_9PSEU|nr:MULTISPECIES: GNAT family protein [Prauserella salsuginis group]MBB3661684.1 RimJ/RimL family protein N-acetyltransferase [Prauserella sediminis]MCR3719593.1 Protein N-acetyltransferase, RimJ/RimL family [Prauserella flava]MCR3735393.1 Protein N-acetyltransferase, RimJ/RimL family [Prauserella salsuginis]
MKQYIGARFDARTHSHAENNSLSPTNDSTTTIRIESTTGSWPGLTLDDLPAAINDWRTERSRVHAEAGAADHAVIDVLAQHGFVLDPVTFAQRTEPDAPVVLTRDFAVPATACEWLPRIPPDGIDADGIVLTHPHPDDLADLLACEQDPGARLHALTEPLDRQALIELLGSAYYRWRVGPASFLIARASPAGPPLAKLSVRRVVPPGVLDVGYVTMPAHRGKGVSTRAVRGFTRWAFTAAPVQRIELGVKPANRRSAAVAERSSYHCESVRKGRLSNLDGSYSDELSYVALRHEWTHHRDKGRGAQQPQRQ